MGSKILEIESLSDEQALQASDYRYRTLIPELRKTAKVVVIRVGLESEGSPVTAGPDCILVGPGVNVTDEVLAIEDIGLIAAAAHGKTDRLQVEGPALFAKGDYPRCMVKDRIIHLLACNTAEELGPRLREAGCWFFFGYKDIFTYGDTEDDRNAVLDCDAEIDRRLALGESAGEVVTAVHLRYQKEIAAARTKSLKEALEHNRDALWCDGDPEARLVNHVAQDHE